MEPLKELEKKGIIELAMLMVNNMPTRKLAIPIIDYKIRKLNNYEDPKVFKVEQDAHYYLFHNLLHTFSKLKDDKLINKQTQKKLVENFVGNIMFNGGDTRDETFEKCQIEIPSFITISPTQKCNLKCKGCYAASHEGTFKSMDWETLDRILTEKKEVWNSYFTVVSGGEPFLWKDGDKDIFDIFEKHNDQFFLVYTNGTLLTQKNTEKLAKLGNVTVAISVEGFEKETDERRGKGTYQKILQAFTNLRAAGVFFGISVTANKKNAELVVSDKFIDFYYGQQRAGYAWLFQYMPIGRGIDFDYMITPEQRLNMYKRGRVINEELGFNYIDFWNNGYMSWGCIAAGRKGGYLYIDWNGNVMPCVFVPYSPVNIHDVYNNGGNLSTVLKSEYFQSIRDWQKEYGFLKNKDEVKNRITPCFIRDHHDKFHEITKKHTVKPIDIPAEEALESDQYHQQMVQYGKDISNILDPVWEKDFLKNR
jgi:MoaA/NifB/PqqE/SkfB family radical SAM enzyme